MASAASSAPAEVALPLPAQPRPTFLRDLRFGAFALILLAAVFAWYGWSGDVFTPLSFVAFGFFFGLPVLLFAWAGSLLSDRPDYVMFKRVAVQVMLVGMMSIPLLFVGVWAEGVSIRATQRRGDRIAASLETYHAAHGAYPKSLAAMEEEARARLPRPTVCDGFAYRLGEDGETYDLRFKGGGIWTVWVRPSGSGVWSRDD
jgi:hypothetical protein